MNEPKVAYRNNCDTLLVFASMFRHYLFHRKAFYFQIPPPSKKLGAHFITSAPGAENPIVMQLLQQVSM